VAAPSLIHTSTRRSHGDGLWENTNRPFQSTMPGKKRAARWGRRASAGCLWRKADASKIQVAATKALQAFGGASIRTSTSR
jgi:hypothetical protein